MVLQTVAHIHSVWWVFVMSKVALSSVTVAARRAVLKEKGGEVVVLVFLPYLMYLCFCLHNYMNFSRNKISTFRILNKTISFCCFRFLRWWVESDQWSLAHARKKKQ